MADWKTYAKAARNTVRKQAPEVRDATQRATSRAGGYARAAGKAVQEGTRADEEPRESGRRPEGTPPAERTSADAPRPRSERTTAPGADDAPARRSEESPPSSSRSIAEEARIYATAAGRTAQHAGEAAKEAGIGPRIARAVRDALLIGVSIFVIWGVLYAAGLPIPFSAVLIAVLIIMAIALGTGLYAQFVRDKASRDEDESAQ
ncbi:hypothetical protein [Brachybacterium sp. YJGR34]|uniref:hypothetical protein n=1 Tax=Brachybacterium sp. YJGR34 TaxID=2059911 RepID=UPI000E0AFDB8|nr:hypothetical protein [Brachybacterium sp. YJGR34]